VQAPTLWYLYHFGDWLGGDFIDCSTRFMDLRNSVLLAVAAGRCNMSSKELARGYEALP
jgi:hypothetical protein